MRGPPESARLHGLDTLRGLAVVFVVLLHAGIPYMVRPLPHLVWPAVDCFPCLFVDGAAWWIECFIMPLFFLLAGFFSAGLIVQLGPRAFFQHRTKRLLWPLLAACAVVLPACIYLWALGWAADGLFVPGPLLKMGIPAELKAELFGTAHLWFLQYLYLYCLILCGTKVLRNRCLWIDSATQAVGRRIGQRFHQLVPLVCTLSLLAVASAAILYWDPRIVLGFHQSFVPVVSKLLYYAVFYFTGVLLHANQGSLMLRARYGKLYVLVATAAFVLILPLIREHVTAELTGPWRLLLASLVAAFGWLMAYGLFESFLLARRGSNRVTRYLSQASYWIYVVHLPFVVLAQIAIARLPVPALLKFLVSATIAMFLALMTYQVFVRHTWVGGCLNGPAGRDAGEAAIPLRPQVVIPEIPALTAACAQLASSSVSASPAILGAVNLRP